jgi:cob(I)alamin adenosyltransferase
MRLMKEVIYERRGLDEDNYSHEWFCSLLHQSRRVMAKGQLDEAESIVGYACLFALERMSSDALAAGLGVLAEILAKKGQTLQDYVNGNGRAA